MNTRLLRSSAVVALSTTMALGLAACGSSGTSGSTGNASNGVSNQKVTISIDCEPAKSQPAQRKWWLHAVSAFEKKYPNITIKGIDKFPCESPDQFTAQLKAGTEPDVFYTYYTDQAQVLNSGQAADITKYVTSKTVPHLDSIKPELLNVLKKDGKLYGLPRTNYTMGMIINKKLFTKAGLDPSKPPTTWAEVATDAKKIAALGNGINGYGDYSAGHNGGWHFTAEMDALGGTMVNADGTKATFNNANGRAILENLHKLRFTDNVMGKTQLLKYGDLQKQMASGKLGMYIAAPDDITYMVDNLGAKYADFAMGPIPGTNGPAKGTLAGGDDYYFNKHDTPAQIEAGVKWLNFEYLTPGAGQFDFTFEKSLKLDVGLPEPAPYNGAPEQKIDKDRSTHATMPTSAFTPYVNANVKGIFEPPSAQQIYKVLDTTMAAVLTKSDANIPQLLSTAEQQVNQILANQ